MELKLSKQKHEKGILSHDLDLIICFSLDKKFRFSGALIFEHLSSDLIMYQTPNVDSVSASPPLSLRLSGLQRLLFVSRLREKPEMKPVWAEMQKLVIST